MFSLNVRPFDWNSIGKHLNFYRVHILFFSFTPLIFSAIFYASNGQYHISYIDSLFNCVSAMTVCGLAVNDLSTLTGWQQTILFIQMCLGSPVVAAWVMVYIRRYHLAKVFDEVTLKALGKAEEKEIEKKKAGFPMPRRLAAVFRKDGKVSVVEQGSDRDSPEPESKGMKRLNTQMIRRMDNAPILINPSGMVTDSTPRIHKEGSSSTDNGDMTVVDTERLDNRPTSPGDDSRGNTMEKRIKPRHRSSSDPGLTPSTPNFMERSETMMPHHQSPQIRRRNVPMQKTQTVEFASDSRDRRSRPEPNAFRLRSQSRHSDDRRSRRSTHGIPLEPKMTMTNHGPHYMPKSKHTGFGGFPMPFQLLKSLMNKFFPSFHRRLTRTVTIPLATTIASQRADSRPPGSRPVPYVSFEAVIGRNSSFHMLTHEQMEEVGGVEYRALNALLWIVATYHIVAQLLPFIILTPYMMRKQWAEDFIPPNLHKPLAPPWYTLFQVVSAYTNTGTSLVDQSMVPFQKAYFLILVLVFLILAGNTCFPIFLRFTIWILTKLVPSGSRTNETLHFLLDHPRRCFIYLFPSHQTWFLLTVVLILNFTDWCSFMLLDINNPFMKAIPLGTRFLAGLLQAIAVRAAGFGIVTLAELAPAVKVLYVIMMYISVYPIAMSVRSTNVYEEQSLGVYQDGDDQSDFDRNFAPSGENRVQVWGRYLTMHARRQLAFDMWWLGLALFLVCIIERANIDNEENQGWFSIFTIMFELVSAYGTVGLSLGVPYANYSLSGAFSTASKIVVCFVMLRGRHRGLPVAIDRAVMISGRNSNDRIPSIMEDPFERTSRVSRTFAGEELSQINEDDHPDGKSISWQADLDDAEKQSQSPRRPSEG